ncbi:uncharacterized protein LOC135327376 [Dromaius novaehollandiae]|uniref:uncharacterized protein LOC135327376 n=1 Tax=Dromaius novaehollandiae TaxID=8790 RepID=UPI00311E70F1
MESPSLPLLQACREPPKGAWEAEVQAARATSLFPGVAEGSAPPWHFAQALVTHWPRHSGQQAAEGSPDRTWPAAAVSQQRPVTRPPKMGSKEWCGSGRSQVGRQHLRATWAGEVRGEEGKEGRQGLAQCAGGGASAPASGLYHRMLPTHPGPSGSAEQRVEEKPRRCDHQGSPECSVDRPCIHDEVQGSRLEGECERGVAISCQGKGCSRSFHLPCTSEHSCVTQFFKEFSSFCWEHRPEQAVQVHPDVETTCIICLEPVGDKISHNTMACPACKGTWFHRGCIRGQVVPDSRSCFHCPHCNNTWRFLPEMLKMGILVPSRTPAWEEDTGCEELYQRHSWCDASQCLSRQGRQQAEERGPWELLLCSSCASKGTHRRCSALGTGSDSWECDECAGLGPASTVESELAGAGTSTSSQPQLASSCSSPAPQSSSRSGQTGPD